MSWKFTKSKLLYKCFTRTLMIFTEHHSVPASSCINNISQFKNLLFYILLLKSWTLHIFVNQYTLGNYCSSKKSSNFTVKRYFSDYPASLVSLVAICCHLFNCDSDKQQIRSFLFNRKRFVKTSHVVWHIRTTTEKVIT